MKHVGKLAIIGALSKTKLCSYHARSPLSYTAQGFQLASVAHISQNSQGSRIAAEHGVVKAKGSWVTLDTPAQKLRVPLPPSLPPPRSCCWSAWWENFHHSRIFFFLCEQTFLTAFHSRLQLRLLMRQHFFFNVEPLVSIYIARKLHQNYQPLETIF